MSDTDCSTAAGEYDLPLHIASVFVMIVASGLGVFAPVIAPPGNIFFVFKYFGSGIIISLAFCHLLQDSFETFDNPCIGDLAYEPTAPAIAMASALLMFGVDYLTARRVGSPVAPSPGSDPDQASDLSDPKGAYNAHSVEMLEGGILFHSIMIGVALGAQTDGFATTFVALVFHQLFEGLGLGARLATLHVRTVIKWAMCMAYTLITPVGIAIGIGVHQSFNNTGPSELLAVGVLNAISAGILLYSGLCQLLYAEWVVGDMRTASTGRVWAAVVALALGLFAMSLIGKWT